MTEILYPAPAKTADLKVQNVKAYRTLDLTGIPSVIITWDEYVPDDKGVLYFNLYRSNGGEIFSLYASGLTITSYLDSTANLIPATDYHYKVTYTNSNGESDLDDATEINYFSNIPFGLEGRIHWIGMETTRRMQMILNNFGETVLIFTKKRFGIPCPECYDAISNASNNPRCPICQSAGFVGATGGYDKFNGKLLWTPNVETLVENEMGRERNLVPKTYVGAFPILHSEDVIIRQDNVRYIIGGVQNYMLQNFLVLQDISVSIVERGHPAWLLE